MNGLDLIATAAAQAPPAAPRKTRRSKTVLSPVPMEIPDGAIMVHSNDSTIAVPSHGGDSVAERVKRWAPAAATARGDTQTRVPCATRE